ncbi:MAG TPA: amidase [Pseudonocardiaceae bacterium]|nr:amidase [Pseudonocardiaceae bacterium]
MTDLHELSALEQAAAIRRGELSPAELVAHQLARIDRLNSDYGAFITVTSDRAMAAAAFVRAPGSPLAGVPTAIKDLTPTAGVRTTYGSRVHADSVPTVDAHSVTLLREAGLISLGKTTTPEFGMVAYTDNDLVGPARTPWNREYGAGGSSGGAAVAVALGLVPVAHGSDGGGSIRIPASLCGVFGIKPSRGRVSAGPDTVDITGMSVQGPIARTVRDAAALLDVLAVPMPGDPYWAPPLPPGETFLGHADRDPGRLRIGRYAVPASGQDVDPVCLAAWDHASGLLEGLGHEIEDIPTPFPAEIVRSFATCWAVRSLGHAVPPEQESLLRPVTRAWREYGRKIDGADFAAAIATMQVVAGRSIRATADYDVVLTPTLATAPQPVAHFAEDDPEANLRRQAAFSAFTSVYNMTGQPAVNIPLHWTDDNLPVGVSLIGRPADEATLIALSAQLEAAHPWQHRRPPAW